MHSATTATGRPLPPPGKSLPKNRPAPLSCRAARQLAAPKPHVTSELQCYIPTPASTRLPRARFANGHSFTQSAFCEGSRITPHSRSNRHTPRLENAISRRKQTLGRRSNRHFLRVSGSHQRRVAAADRPPQVPSNIVSNRQWQILEINVNLSKQTIAPRSNRHKNVFIKCQKSNATTARRNSKSERQVRAQQVADPPQEDSAPTKAKSTARSGCATPVGYNLQNLISRRIRRFGLWILGAGWLGRAVARLRIAILGFAALQEWGPGFSDGAGEMDWLQAN